MLSPSRTLRPSTAILVGSLTIGILDGAFAVVRALMRGGSPGRMFQGIAAGLLGRSAFEGGSATILLGVAIHFLIATTVMVTYYLASRRVALLNQHPIVLGSLYGIGVFAVMNFIVIPLSALSMPARGFATMIPGILIHVVGVGIPAALLSRIATPDRT